MIEGDGNEPALRGERKLFCVREEGSLQEVATPEPESGVLLYNVAVQGDSLAEVILDINLEAMHIESRVRLYNITRSTNGATTPQIHKLLLTSLVVSLVALLF